MEVLTGFEGLSVDDRQHLIQTMLEKKYGLIDKDWAEIVEEYKLTIKPDTLRKAAVGLVLADSVSKEKEEAKAELPIGSAGVPKIDDAFIEKQTLRDLRNEVNGDMRQIARSRHLEEAIKEAIKNLPTISSDRNSRKTSAASQRSNSTKERRLVICLGDFHYGAEFEIKGLQGEPISTYNPNVFDRYMTRLYFQIQSILNMWEIENVEILFTGDLIDGMLRDSQLMRLKYGIVDSTIRLAEYLAHWVKLISDEVTGKTTVHSTIGNHSEIRPLGSKAGQFADENMERIVMWYLRERLRYCEQISIDENVAKRVMFDILGYNFVLLHGDDIGFRNISSIARDSVNLYGKKVDYFVCGHLHNEETIRSGMTKDGNSYIIRVPSLCGMDAYASEKGLGNRPGATAIIMEEGYGRRCVYPIDVTI